MSSPHILRGGSVAAAPFTASLHEITVPRTSKKKASHEAARLRDLALAELEAKAEIEGREAGFENGRKAGYQAGFDQAYAEGSNRQSEMLREFAVELQQVHDQLEASITEWFATAETEIERLGLVIAEKLIGAQLALDRSFVIETTKEALRQLTEANRARIRVNPFDSVILSNAREELLAASASLRGIEIVEDSSILGGCVIETERGAVDATIATRLEILEGGLEDAA